LKGDGRAQLKAQELGMMHRKLAISCDENPVFLISH
jgi:hypothetical protein